MDIIVSCSPVSNYQWSNSRLSVKCTFYNRCPCLCFTKNNIQTAYWDKLEVNHNNWLCLVEEHPGEEPAEEFPIHRREEQKRQSRPVIAAAAVHVNVWICCNCAETVCRRTGWRDKYKLHGLWMKRAAEALWAADRMDFCELWNSLKLDFYLIQTWCECGLRLWDECSVHIFLFHSGNFHNVY